ncbi:MAG: hypothetical protein ABEK84_11050 [Salinibacter sp.]
MSYTPPSLSDFRELRRGLPVLAAILLLAAILMPMWQIYVHAVQYPETTLHLQLYAYPRIAGDYWEMAELNQYIGFYYPDPVYWTPNFEVHEAAVDVPEWSFGPLAFLLVAAAGVFVAFAPSIRKLKLGLTSQLIGTVTVLVGIMVDIQYRLYQAGHTLDPDAPVMGVGEFTPPLWGRYEVANITSYSRFGSGAYMVAVAAALLVLAYYYRDSETTFGDVFARIRGWVRGGKTSSKVPSS